jgi:RHS repeat-associated protein
MGHDYLPYGEEIIGFGNRTTSDNYQTDDVRQGFTGYEKDDETGLDFAQARMYNKNHGRFTTTDPIYFQSEMVVDPQRFNLYGYVRNNPLKFIDPLGMKLRISANGNAEQAMADARTLAGDFAKHLVFDPVKDKDGNILYYDVSFNVTAEDIAGNEGAQLIFDLVGSDKTFLSQRGGTVQRKYKDGKNKGKIENVDVNESGGGNVTRNRPGQTGIFEPVDPNVDSIIYYPENVVFVTIATGEDVQPIRTFIHEAAESYLLAQGIEYNTAHGIYTYTTGTGKKAKVENFTQNPKNAISREKAIAEQLKMIGGASGSSREGSISDLKKKEKK